MTKEITCLLCEERPVFEGMAAVMAHFEATHPDRMREDKEKEPGILARRMTISHSDGDDCYQWEFAWKAPDGAYIAIETDTHPRRRARHG